MTDRMEPGAHKITWPGHRIATGELVPGAGTWEIIEHAPCAGHGKLRALVPGRAAPKCAVCEHGVTWQLTHLASSVAADHRGVGRLP